MNKALLILSLAACTSLQSVAQTRSYGTDEGRVKSSRDVSCPKVYIALSSGINNPAGLAGVGVDLAIDSRVSVGGGIGLSSWGTKLALEGRYYFDECNRGWAVGGGVTTNGGLRNVVLGLETAHQGPGTPVTLDLHRKTNLFFSGYRFFNLGRNNRFHLQLGYSQGLQRARYTVKSGHTLTTTSDAVVRTISPGGIVLGLGFSFGIGS